MQAIRMLVSTAATLAATAVAWAQAPDSSKKADPPAAVRRYRVTTSQVKYQKVEPAPAKKAQAPGATVIVDVPEADNAEVLHRVLRLTEGKANDPHREILTRLKAVAHESCVQCHAGGVTVRKDDALGLVVVAADETLRSQLKLDGKGLVVTSVEHGSPGDAGGIKEKDIVVALAGKPVGTVDEFQKWLKESGAGAAEGHRAPIVVKVVRAGEAKEVRVPPPGAPSLKVGPLKITAVRHQAAPSYWIGVAIGEADDTLRAHLKLDEGAGLVLTDVIKESPAAKAGLEKNDVVLSVDAKPLKEPGDLVKAVQAAKDEHSLTLAVRRAGDGLKVAVRPEKRKEPEVAAAGAILKDDQQPQAWVTTLAPLLNDNMHQLTWATPAQPGQTFFLNPMPAGGTQPYTLQLNAAVADAHKKAAEAANPQVVTILKDLEVLLRADVADRKVVTDLVKKAAAPPETLARIDAQLKALEAQVGEIKRSMDDLKASIKKEPR
jgi:C-terminal processing protease CtpA/Prc